jgi:hypothetical protein
MSSSDHTNAAFAPAALSTASAAPASAQAGWPELLARVNAVLRAPPTLERACHDICALAQRILC